MPLLFDKAQDTLDDARTFHENALEAKKEEVDKELASIANRVDEFNDFDDINKMAHYQRSVNSWISCWMNYFLGVFVARNWLCIIAPAYP